MKNISGRDAFETAYGNYTDTVFRIAYHNTCNYADAEDITQDVFTKLLEKNRKFENTEHLKAWLIRVTINLCHNVNKRKSRLSELDPNIAIPEKEDNVLDAVMQLPEKYKTAIYLHYYEGYTASEISEIQKIKQSTVLSHLSRGRELLKEKLKGGFDE